MSKPDPKDDWLPSPEELDQAPQLALLAVLDRSLEIAAYAVLVAHPELSDPEPPPYWRPPDRSANAAESLLRVAARLRRALSLYRITTLRATLSHPPGEPLADDLPF